MCRLEVLFALRLRRLVTRLNNIELAIDTHDILLGTYEFSKSRRDVNDRLWFCFFV